MRGLNSLLRLPRTLFAVSIVHTGTPDGGDLGTKHMSKASFLRNTTVELAHGFRSAISSVLRCVFEVLLLPGSLTWVAAFVSGNLTVLYEYVYC